MTTARKLIVGAVAVILLALGGPALALAVPGAIHAIGTATAFNLSTGGVTVKGGLADWEFACASCGVAFTLAVPDLFFAAQDGTVFTTLPAGSYAIDGFAGYASYTFEGPSSIFIELHGVGRLSRR